MSEKRPTIERILRGYLGEKVDVSEYSDLEEERRPKGYWKDWKNLKKELRNIIRRIGHFPSQKELSRLDLTGISRAVNIHGGFPIVSEKMGYRVIKRTNGYWQDFSNVRKELEKIIEDVGAFPTSSQLIKIGYSGLSTGMQQYHGGIRNVRTKMGYENEFRPNGYWKEWENVEKEIKKLRKKLGHFPSSTEMDKNGLASLSGAIVQYHGGMKEVRKKFGAESNIKPVGYWDNWNNLEKELKLVIKQLGHFPTQKELQKLKKSSLTIGIGRHGGFAAIQERMGYEISQRPDGYWKDFSNVQKELEKIVGETEEFPTQTYLTSNGYGSLNHGIIKYHKGLTSVRKKLGYGELVKPKGYWKNWKNVKRTLKKIVKELGHFPNRKDFDEKGYSRLPGAILEFHGGMRNVREKLGYEQARVADGEWKKFSNVKNVLLDLEEKLGHFPSQSEIVNAGYGGLPSAIVSYHGGLNNVAEKLNKVTKQRKTGFWTKRRTFSMCREFFNEFGYFPLQKELDNRKDKYRGLASGINKHGGADRIRIQLGIGSDRKPDGYWDRETVLEEATKLYSELGYWPKQKELCNMGRNDLVSAISINIGVAELRKRLGIKVTKVPDGYWSEQRILEELSRRGLSEVKLLQSQPRLPIS